jgi:xylulose-5-phosphate/fructose-6-phosphate phosphoketolase
LHLNGYKIANSTIRSLFVGHGCKLLFAEREDPAPVHQRMASTPDEALGRVQAIQRGAYLAARNVSEV